ncbi:MAG: ATP-binding protein [Thermodesulfobacteriota bacterium]|nr:ATP-binding protein [Thermodesulfobacteriota bacterium]
MDEINIKSINETFAVTERDLAERKQVAHYIASIAPIVADRFHNEYLLKEKAFARYMENDNIPRMKTSFTDFIIFLFASPWNEHCLERCRRAGVVHHAIGLNPLHLSRGFDAVQEILFGLAAINETLHKNLRIILKFLRIAEQTMHHAYHERNLHTDDAAQKRQSPVELFEIIYSAFKIHQYKYKQVVELLDHDDPAAFLDATVDTILLPAQECPFHATLERMLPYRETLISFDVDIEELRTIHDQWHDYCEKIFAENQTEKTQKEFAIISRKMSALLDKPLQDMASLSYLAINSGTRFIHRITELLFHKEISQDHSVEAEFADLSAITRTSLEETMSWCIEQLVITEEEHPTEEYDLFLHILYHQQSFNIYIKLNPLPNKRFLKELLEIYLEVLKIYFMNREREQDLLEMATRAEAANRAKDLFLANMSHELRTPLNAILGFSQILAARPDVDESLKTYIGKIHQAGKHLLSLVNTILDFAKLEAGKFTFKQETTGLQELLREVTLLTEVQIKKKGLHFIQQYTDDMELYLDRDLIKQTLVNLLSNSIKFTPEGGTITLDVAYNQQHRQTLFSVTDSGCGIPVDHLHKIFEPFHQSENPYRKSTQGTGLGLAISKKIIEELHGGIMRVVSVVGQGSTFSFSIPDTSVKPCINSYKAEQSDAAHILIAEDSEDWLFILRNQFEGDFNISTTNSVTNAKKLLQQHHFQHLILDFYLLDGTAEELLQFMKTHEIDTPVTLVSVEKQGDLVLRLQEHPQVQALFDKDSAEEIASFVKQQLDKLKES